MKRIYVKVRIEDEPKGASYIDEPNNIDLGALIDGCDPGCPGYIISTVEMYEEEFKTLPEFQGF